MKVDVIIEAGASARDLAELSQLAEQGGIRCLWACSFPGRRDPFIAQTVAALRTQTLRHGVMPVSPYEIHPLKLAELSYSLNEIANGRAMLLLGGLGKSVTSATGLEPKRRVRAVAECLTIIKGLGSGAPFDFAGEIYRINAQQLSWSGRELAVYLGANGPQMLTVAGRMADGVMMSDVTTHHMGECLDALRRGREQRANNAPVAVNNFWAWHVKPSIEDARAEARRELVWRGVLQRWHISPFLSAADCDLVEAHWHDFLNAFLQKTSAIDNVPDRVVDALVDGLTLTAAETDLAPVIDKMRQLEQSGMTEIALRLHDRPDQAIETIGRHIVPALDH